MADSDITASGLVASEGTGSVALQWSVANPHELGLPYLDLALVEVWASATNNRAAATLAGSAAKGQNTFVHTLEGGTTRYYWVRPKNAAGYYGDWHPLSASAGVSGTAGVVDEINGGEITNSVVTASTFRTAESGERFEINAVGSKAEIFGSAGNLRAYFGIDPEVDAVLFVEQTVGLDAAAVLLADGDVVQIRSNVGNAIEAVTTTGTRCIEAASPTYAFYAASGVYGPFTGSHDALIAKDNVEIEIGDVVVTAEIVAKRGVSDTLRRIVRSATANDPAAIGVLATRRPILHRTRFAALTGDPPPQMIEAFDHVVLNGVGEGQINVCGQNGPIRRGDLLVTSDMPGKAMRQADDVMRSCTIARADEDADLGVSEVAMIACIYSCG